MIVFNCDLDNTLIYSYKHDLGEPGQCVEYYQGKELSFMTDRAMEQLEAVNRKVLLVPTTTRSIEQYNRIHLGSIVPDYALVCNGGVLLYKGAADAQWYQESRELVRPAVDAIARAITFLETDPDREFEIRHIEELFLFTKSRAPEKTVRCLREKLDPEWVDVFSNGTKVYVLPKSLTKGHAVLRLKKRLAAEIVIAAGDSEFDIPMLETADYGFCPEGLITGAEHIRTLAAGSFTLSMLQKVEQLLG